MDNLLESVLRQAQQEVQTAWRDARAHGVSPTRITLDVALELAAGPSQGVPALRPAATPVGPGGHRLTVTWDAVPVPAQPTAPPPPAARTPPASVPDEAGSGGDAATLARRLQLVLGGPPGFTTGAKAEVLADLLAEFGRAALLETLRRDWIRQFDTGFETSPSVTPAP